MKKESALPDRPYGNLKGSKWALTALIRMKTTVAKTLANRPSAWQVTLPGFLPCVFIRKPLIFKGFRAVDALLGSKKSLARKKKHAGFWALNRAASMGRCIRQRGPEYLLGPPPYFTDLKQHTSITAFPAGLRAMGS